MAGEVSLALDEFNKAKIYNDTDTIAIHILNLIEGDKDTDPLNPDKNVAIKSYIYRLDDPSTINELTKDITTQIEKYTPYVVTSVNIRVVYQNILIIIQLADMDDMLFFTFDKDSKSSFEILKNS